MSISFFKDSAFGPIAWSIRTASIPYAKNFLVELIKCSWTSGFSKFNFGRSEKVKKDKCLYSFSSFWTCSLFEEEKKYEIKLNIEK